MNATRFTQENTSGFTDAQLNDISDLYNELMMDEMEKQQYAGGFDEFESLNPQIAKNLAEKAIYTIDINTGE